MPVVYSNHCLTIVISTQKNSTWSYTSKKVLLGFYNFQAMVDRTAASAPKQFRWTRTLSRFFGPVFIFFCFGQRRNSGKRRVSGIGIELVSVHLDAVVVPATPVSTKRFEIETFLKNDLFELKMEKGQSSSCGQKHFKINTWVNLRGYLRIGKLSIASLFLLSLGTLL